jgi:N-carbamoylputrescine amidase
MSRILRAALTETCNVYADMPPTVDRITELAGRLDDVRNANLDHHVELIATAASAGAKIICLGELFSMPYFALGREPMWLDCAEDASAGPTIKRCRDAARQSGIAVVAPIYELDGSNGKRFNTAVVIDESGQIAGKYRKTHIPAGANEQSEFFETFYYQASDGNLGASPSNRFFPVFDLGSVRLGVAICYDRHFPGVMKALSESGAELVVSPAVTFGEKSRRMWDLEFPVDAARHNLFIGGSNRRGAEAPWNQDYFGASYFVGPNGRVTAVPVHENLVVADLDLDALSGPDPSGWDLDRDRRPDIY